MSRSHTYTKNRAILLADDPPCAYCTAPAVEADHYLPIVLGGTDDLDNLQPICRRHNRQKSGRPPWEFTPAGPIRQAGPGDW